MPVHTETATIVAPHAPAAPSDQDNALSIHNKARSDKHLTPLQWDPKLAAAATKYAQHLAQIGKLQHSEGSARPGQGENLYGTSSSHTPLADGARAWINEGAKYHHEKIPEGDFGSYGHYSESAYASPWRRWRGL